MTTQRKDEMPEVWISWKETIKQKNTDNFNVHLWPCVFDHKRDYAVKYIRADLSPPVPDDVAEAPTKERIRSIMKEKLSQYPNLRDNEIAISTANILASELAKEFGAIIRAAGTPSAEVRGLRDIEDAARVFCQVISNADFDATERQIGYEVLKGALDAYEALNQTSKSVINKVGEKT